MYFPRQIHYIHIKHKLYKITLIAGGTTQLVISDGFGTYPVVAGVPVVLDYGGFGKVQTTSDTIITVTPTDVSSIAGLCQYDDIS